MILSHRLLRYSTPALHVLALAANVALVRVGRRAPLYMVTLDLQLALLLAAALAGVLPRAPAADRALLRAHDRLARRRAVGLAAARDRRDLGSGRGDAVSAAARE